MLLKFIAEVAYEPVVLDPDHRAAESQTNTWSLGATDDDRASLTAAQVAAAFEHTAEALRGRVRDLRFQGTVTFYVWHDEQVGALRCSTSSLPPETLPFSGAYSSAETPIPIAAAFLADAEPGIVPWTDLAEVEHNDLDQAQEEPTPRRFLVWARDIGRRD